MSTDLHAQTVELDTEIEQAGAAGGKGLANSGTLFGWYEAEETSATTCAADFGGLRTGSERPRNQIVDLRRAHSWCQHFSIGPFIGQTAACRRPVGAFQCLSHRGCRVSNAFETVEHVSVTVDVTFHDVPVVRA